ncbi:IS4 family transposase [uncultured Paludibaculum sp.]|uniref:IS4 family transposase n=1 Tax=uncultured Paludibaculum sp. TaxID=1765020 RepID=UPI002AAB1B7C|nr:IS4 family transposase [uncultured Paludibaculum sp.]
MREPRIGPGWTAERGALLQLSVGAVSFSHRDRARATPKEGKTILQAASLFNQLLHHFPRNEFAALVKKHGAERSAKGFTCWTQFVSMLFCQLGRADSLREICNGLSCCLGKLVHLGIAKAPRRSTLSYANEHRPAALFEDLFWTSLARFRDSGTLGPRKHKFRFKNKLLSLDSTTITLCLNLFPWAKFRRAKGGVKAHVLLDHDDYLPAYVLLTEARRSDVKMADSFLPNPGSIVAMDRGYNDYALFGRWTKAGVFFVTRLKDDAQFEIVEERTRPQNSAICVDQIIRLSSAKGRAGCPHLLRRVVVWVPEKDDVIVLLTNHLEFGATTIAAIYKDRWKLGVSRQGHIVQSVKDRPGPKDSGLVAWEAPWRESKTAEPSDNILRKECARRTRLQRKVNADVASLHEIPVAETV